MKPSAGVTVRMCVERYLRGGGRSVVDERGQWIRWKNMEPTFGPKLVGVHLYALSATYHHNRVKAGRSPSTVRREFAVLRAAFKHAQRDGLIPYIPVLYVPKNGPARKRILTKEELTKLLVAAAQMQGECRWLLRFLLLLVHTAQRKDAVLQLEWDQVDLKARVIDFNNKKITLAERRKGRGVVPINDDLFAYLKAWRGDGCSYICHHDDGKKVKNIYDTWRKMVRLAGLGRDVTPHTIRHTVATWLVHADEDIRKVQLLLGHKSITTTEAIYVKNDPEEIRGTVGRLGGLGFKHP